MPGGIGTSPDSISPLLSSSGIVNQKMDLLPFFSLITFGVDQNYKKFLKYLMQLYGGEERGNIRSGYLNLFHFEKELFLSKIE